MKLSKKYQQILTTDKRYTIITGGRGGGKSFGANTVAGLLSFETLHKILFTRYTMTSAKDSVIPEFMAKIGALGAEGSFKTYSDEVENVYSKSTILFRGIKTSSGIQTAQLKSIEGLTTWIYEEAEESTEEDFDKIDLSIRSNDRHNRIILILNPSDVSHWIFKRWFENSYKIVQIDGCDVHISTHPDVLHIHITYLDNLENLSKSFLDIIRKLRETDRKAYGRKAIGTWELQNEGVIFKNWKEGEFDTSLPYCYGQDYGYSLDPNTLVKVAIDDKLKKIYLDELYYKSEQLSTAEIYQINKSLIDHPDDLIVGDSAEQRLIDELFDKGLNIIPAEKGPDSVREGITSLLDYELIVTERSHNLKKELLNYKWNNKKAGIPIDSFNHLIDPTRYAFKQLSYPRAAIY